MRITIRMSTAAEAGFMSVPLLKEPGDSYFTDERLDEAKVRKELGNHPCIQFSSEDNAATLAFTVEVLDRLKLSLNRFIEKSGGCARTSDKEARPTPAMRRFDKGKFAFTRLDVSLKGRAIKARVSVQNPRNCVGGTEVFAGLLAQAVADNLLEVKDEFARNGADFGIELVEGDGCEGIFARSRVRNDLCAARARHETCEFRRSGMLCSPCQFGCELFREGGKCSYDLH